MNDLMNPDCCDRATALMMAQARLDDDLADLADTETERALDVLSDIRDFLDMAEVAAEAEDWDKFRSLMDEAKILIATLLED